MTTNEPPAETAPSANQPTQTAPPVVMPKKSPFARAVGAFAERPLVTLLSILGLFILGASLTALFKSPGIQFAVSMQVSGFEMRVGEAAGIIRDIEGRSLSVDGSGTQLDKGGSNNPLQAGTNTNPSIALPPEEGRLVKLDTLTVGTGSLLAIRYQSRDKTLVMSVEAENGAPDNEATVTWLDGQGDGGGASSRASARTIGAPRLVVEIEDAATEPGATLPLDIKAIQFTSRITGPNASYPISLVSGGRLQFVAMGTALPEMSVEAGEALNFRNLDAQLAYLGIEGGSLVLRVFGTADDVTKGFGPATASVYPSAFAGLGAQPVLQVAISIVLGATLALVGAVSLGSDLTKSGRSED